MTGIDLELDLEEEGQVAGIVPAVERQGFDVDVGGDDLRFFGADTDRVIDDHLIPLGKVNLQVLQTVFVGAGIVNASGVDAYGFLAAGIMDVLVIRHKKSSCSLIGEPLPSGGYPSLSSYESGIKG